MVAPHRADAAAPATAVPAFIARFAPDAQARLPELLAPSSPECELLGKRRAMAGDRFHRACAARTE
jgi:hypothetical protein